MSKTEVGEIATKISARSPIKFPHNATTKIEQKAAGYAQIKYTWVKDSVKYESRWHTRTPGAPLENYEKLMRISKDKNCDFQYETSVGAALPIIKTIQNLRLSGDKISRIDAVLSGSLNFIFNHYNGNLPFADVVKTAQIEGYTEPDPRIDLSGLDVIRKLLILAREAGYNKEIEEVNFKSFLPEMVSKVRSVDAFYGVLRENETFFKTMYNQAQAENAKLKVVAQLKDNQMSIALQRVTPESPFYHLDGKDNIVALYTDMYSPEPLIIKGAGAGAKVTASGVFSDVMYV